MLRIPWGPTGIVMINTHPYGERFSRQYFGQNVSCGPHGKLRPTGFAKPTMVQVANPLPHRSIATLTSMRDFRLQPVPHPAFSPDSAPMDFYLCGPIKEWCGERNLPDARGGGQGCAQLYPAQPIGRGVSELGRPITMARRIAPGCVD
jgi:hypothetical protein